MENKFGLIGKKLSHSFSKFFFEKKFKESGLTDFSYELWEMNELTDIKKFIAEKKYVKGFNITIPFKEEILNYLDEKSDEVKAIGACNCVLVSDTGKWIGYNTDWWGFFKMIENKIERKHKGAVILGTGGAAKAVAYALNKLNLPFVFISRKKQNHNQFKYMQYIELNKSIVETFPVIINTTPIGMYPDVNNMPDIPIDFIDEKKFVIDLIYNPEKTFLLKEAEKRGAKILNGLEMLYLQAEKSWYIWQNKTF